MGDRLEVEKFMMRISALLIGCLMILSVQASPQEVVIRDFPVGVAGHVDASLLEPYYPELGAIADTLHKYPLAQAIIFGGADGMQYQRDTDAKNPGLAVGRAHVLFNLLVGRFKVDSAQLVIQSGNTDERGAQYRYASVRVSRELSDLDSRLEALENRPPIEKHFTEIRDTTVSFAENLGLRLGLGVSTSPFGGIPLGTCTVTWKRLIHVEALVGHTFWNDKFRYGEANLDTKRRLIGGDVTVFPYQAIPVGIMGGWIRIEDISQEYYEYVRLSEGPLFGLKAVPLDFLTLTAAYNPSKQRRVGSSFSTADNDQFLFNVTANVAFGGAK